MKTGDGHLEVEPGLRLYYRILGDGRETLLVPNAVWLEDVLQPLVPGRRLVLYDLRSRGRSDRVTDPDELGIEPDVRDLEAVRRGLDLGRVAVLGHSYPATLVGLHALAHPDAVSRLVLVGAMPPRRLPYFPQGFGTADAILRAPVPRLQELRAQGLDRTDPVAFARAFMRELLLPSQLADPANIDNIPLAACQYPNEAPEHFLRIFMERVMPSLGDWDYRNRLAGLPVPTLVVHGRQDRLPLDGAREWASAMPDARLLALDRSGHYPFVERADAFFPAVDAFLQGEWPEAAERPGYGS